jgi:hypothetical protein
MKYQSQHDLIDPEVPPPETDAEPDREQDSGAGDDAYVIGEQRSTVQVLEVKPARKSKRGTKAWVQPLGIALGVVFVGLTVWNLSRLLGDPSPPPTPSPYQLKQALYLGVMKIDAYWRVHGVTPSSLGEAGLFEEGGYGYRRIDPQHYMVSFQGNGPRLEYDSNIPRDRFFGAPQDILSMGASK